MRMGRGLAFSLVALTALLAAERVMASDYYGTESPYVLGAGARSSALGLAGASSGADASVLAYNPAHLAFLEWKEVVFYRTVLFDSKSVYHALSYAQPLLHMGTIGVSVMRLDVGGVEERNRDNELLSGDLKNAQTRMLIGYAGQLGGSVRGGLNLKVDHQSLAGANGTGVGLDIGLTANQTRSRSSIIRSIHESVVIQNAIEPKVKLVEDGVTDPMRIAFGVSALSAIGDVLLVTAIDLYSPRYSPFKIQFAQEVSYLTRYAIRGSLDGDTPTWGVGVRIRGVGFDYAYRSQDIDQNHRVSLSFRFGRSISETRAAARAALEQEVNGAIDSRVKEFERTQVESAIVEGDRLFAEKRYSEALDRYSVAIVWDPGNQHAKQYSEKAQYMRAMQNGNEFYQRGDFVGALLHFRSALERAPGDSTAMAMAHRCNAEISRLKQAKALASRLLKQAIESYDGRRFSDALTGFEDVLRVDPANEFARELRDRCAANIDRIVQEHRRKARRAAESGDYSEAVRELESIAAYVKLDRDTEREIGELLEAQRRAENRAQTRISAIAQQQPASKSAPNESSIKKLEQRYSEAMESFKAGDFDAAIKGFQDVWAVDPAFHAVSEFLTKAFLLKGMRLYGQERYDEAATSWRLALNIDPENEKIKRYLEKIGEELQRARGDKRG